MLFTTYSTEIPYLVMIWQETMSNFCFWLGEILRIYKTKGLNNLLYSTNDYVKKV